MRRARRTLASEAARYFERAAAEELARGGEPVPRPVILSEGAVLFAKYRGEGPNRVRLDWLGERLGVTKEFVRQLLAGSKFPSLEIAVAIEQLTGIAPRTWVRSIRRQSQPPVPVAALPSSSPGASVEEESRD